MLGLYKLTELERKVENLYREKGLLNPSDLEIKKIAKALDIHIDYSTSEGPQRAIWDDETAVIFLNPNLPERTKRDIFFHELSHPLMHCGDQSIMKNTSFRELQEFQANQFRLYAAIPFFMLKELKLPKYENQIIHFIERVFNVSHNLAKQRFEQIKRRIIQSHLDGCYVEYESDEEYPSTSPSYPLLEDLFSPGEIKLFQLNKPKKKKNKVYYDTLDGKVIPLWYTIEIDRGEINWSKKLKRFPIDATFELVPISEFKEYETDAPIPATNLVLHPSKPNDFCVQLHSLKEMLFFFDVDPYNIRRLIINVQDLERLLQLTILNDKKIRITNN